MVAEVTPVDQLLRKHLYQSGVNPQLLGSNDSIRLTDITIFFGLCALSNFYSIFLYLKTEAEPASETSWFTKNVKIHQVQEKDCYQRVVKITLAWIWGTTLSPKRQVHSLFLFLKLQVDEIKKACDSRTAGEILD